MLLLSPVATDPSPALVIIGTGVTGPNGPLPTAIGASQRSSRPSSLGHGCSPPSSSAPTKLLTELPRPRMLSAIFVALTKLSRPPSAFEHRCLRHLLPARRPSRRLSASKLHLGRLRPPPRSPNARLPNQHFDRPTSIPDTSAISARLGVQVGASMPPNSTLITSDLHLSRPMPDFQIGTLVVRPPPRMPPPSPPSLASKSAPQCLRTPPRSPPTSVLVARCPTSKSALQSSDLHPERLHLLRPSSSSLGLRAHKPPGLRASLRPSSKLPTSLDLSAKPLRTSQPPLAPFGSPGLPRPSSADAPGLPRPPSMDVPGLPRPLSASRQSPFGRLSLPWLPPALPASLDLRARMLPASLGLSSQDQPRTTFLGTDPFSEARSILNQVGRLQSIRS